MPAPRTKPGPALSDVARHLVLPDGITSTAWPSVQARCRTMGVTFDPWQVGLVQGALAKREDGKYAATVGGVVMSIPRQVGKTFFVGMVMMLAMCWQGVWTAASCANAMSFMLLWLVPVFVFSYGLKD